MLATAFSKGPPYRKSFYTNIPFAVAVFVLTAFTCMLCIYPGPSLSKFFQIKLALNKEEMNFKICLLGFAVANFFICIFIEKVIVPSTWLKKVSQFLMGKKYPKNKFKVIQFEMEKEGWPPHNYNGEEVSNRVAHHIVPGIS